MQPRAPESSVDEVLPRTSCPGSCAHRRYQCGPVHRDLHPFSPGAALTTGAPGADLTDPNALAPLPHPIPPGHPPRASCRDDRQVRRHAATTAPSGHLGRLGMHAQHAQHAANTAATAGACRYSAECVRARCKRAVRTARQRHRGRCGPCGGLRDAEEAVRLPWRGASRGRVLETMLPPGGICSDGQLLSSEPQAF